MKQRSKVFPRRRPGSCAPLGVGSESLRRRALATQAEAAGYGSRHQRRSVSIVLPGVDTRNKIGETALMLAVRSALAGPSALRALTS